MGSWGSLVAQPRRGASTQHTVGTQRHAAAAAVHHPQRTWFSALSKPMSSWSDPQVPDSSWADGNILLGAGMVVFQPATMKVVVVFEREKKFWFLPKGRKDVGESLEQAALREAYEESGYRVEFLPLYTDSRAPRPPGTPAAASLFNCEPIFIGIQSYDARKRGNRISPPGEYLSFWYVGQIPADAVREEGTGMPDEVNYEAHLMTVEDALKCLSRDEARVVDYAWALYIRTLREERRQQDAAAAAAAAPKSPSVHSV
ncbi:NUDIX hydrolase domain-like protein [Mycena polygramma]|nr:NUDIX hydrolase domain-like protein [Mycena polygramma]